MTASVYNFLCKNILLYYNINAFMFTNPVKNLKALGLREDMIVADLGAGSGFYTVPLAKMVPNGKVYALEVQNDFLTTIRNKAKEAHLDNLECILGDVEKIGGTKLKDGIVDAIVASNILFQIEDKYKFIEEAQRILKSDGKLLLIDWSPDSKVASRFIDGIIPLNNARLLFAQKGFVWLRNIEVGEHQYGIIFKNK